MPSDYDGIRADNIREYGEGTRHLSFLGRLYTDRTHFIFELLQNAEDAGAAKILFELFEDRLEVKHDGRPFDERDVRGVCGVGEGTKVEDLTQIGKFGIGFKSVYAYTSAPEVHSGVEHFRIEHYVRPYKAATKVPGNAWTTLFVFAFDVPGLEPQAAMHEIAERLRNLSARTLLFLRNIKEIEYKLPDETGGVYLREAVSHGQARQVTIIGQNNGQDEDENWLVFERPLSVPDSADTVRVEIGFKLEADSKDRIESIVRIKESPLVVYFPTEKSTRFGFLVQGPYRTTPSRDNIPKDDDWNTKLVEETALLLVDALQSLKRMGLLTVALLNTLPIRMDDFPEDGMFYPIVEAVRDALLDQELLPTDDGTFVSARNAKLASAEWLRSLLRDEQLRQLFKTEIPLKWISGEITERAKHDLWKYIREELRVEEVTPESFARKIEGTFLVKQTDDWIIDFYRHLSKVENLWRPGGLLRSKPILRLQDNTQEVPFRSNGMANAYLPPPEETDFPVVKREIADNEQASEFLRHLGLSEPDVFDDIVERVLPKYSRQDVSSITPCEHEMDIKKILRAMASDSESGKKKVLQAAKNTPFLKAVDQNGDSSFKRPDEIYFPNEKLKDYFSGCRDIWFLDEATGEKEWKALGVENKPRFKKISIDLPGEEKSRLRGNQGHTRDIETIDYDLDGLEDFLARFDSEDGKLADHSLILWSFLLDHLKEGYHYSFYEGEYKWFYYQEKSARFNARWEKQVVSNAWLPKAGGIRLHKPHDLSLEELPESFIRDEKLADLLGMQKDEIKKIEEKTGGKFVPRDKYEEFKKWEQQKAKTEKNQESREADTRPKKICYKDELQKSFNRRGETELQEQAIDTGNVKDPDRRREKSYEEHKKRLDHEPKPNERRKETMRIILEGPDEQVREYLFQFYDGRCQICGKTFPERNGNPFFIANYIVPKKLAGFIDTPANALCLCADHFAKWQHGTIEADNIIEQIENFKTEKEGGNSEAVLRIKICGEECKIRYKEKHLLDLQELLRASDSEDKRNAF